MLHGKKISLVVAMTDSRLIGRDNQLPWPKLDEDMRRFRRLTTPHTVVMGRNTWESIPEKLRPLENRQNIILSRNLDYSGPPLVVHAFEEAVILSENYKVFVIGGAEIYRVALQYADELYITLVHEQYPNQFRGNVFFPEYNKKLWKLNYSEAFDLETDIGEIYLDFKCYSRIVSSTSEAA